MTEINQEKITHYFWQNNLGDECGLNELLKTILQAEGKQQRDSYNNRSEGRTTEVLSICINIINYSLEFFKVYMMLKNEKLKKVV